MVKPSRTLERVLLVAHSMRMRAALMISLRLVTTPARWAHAVVPGGR